MFSLRLTALSSLASFLAGVLCCLAVWNYIERGKTIESQRLSMESKDKVIELVIDKSKAEEKITNEKDRKIKSLDSVDKKSGMCPAVRAAIDSLHQ